MVGLFGTTFSFANSNSVELEKLSTWKNQHWCKHVLEDWLMLNSHLCLHQENPRNDNTIASCPIQAVWHLPHSHWLGTRSGSPVEPASCLVDLLLGLNPKWLLGIGEHIAQTPAHPQTLHSSALHYGLNIASAPPLPPMAYLQQHHYNMRSQPSPLFESRITVTKAMVTTKWWFDFEELVKIRGE